MIALAFALLLNAPAQEDLDGAIKDLSLKISKDGISGRPAATAAEDWGLQAVQEWIEKAEKLEASGVRPHR